MGWDKPALYQIAQVFADLYPDPGMAVMVASGAGLETMGIPLATTPVLNWFNILQEAVKQERVPALVALARRQYPRSEGLRRAAEGWGAPAVQGPEIDPGDRSVPTGAALEQMVSGEASLVDVSFLEIGLRRAQAVARVICGSGATGTGFLITGGLLVTNHHVLPDRAAARAAKAQFNYQRTAEGADAPSVTFDLEPQRFFRTSPCARSRDEEGDDWTVVAVAGAPEEQFAPIALGRVEIAKGDRVNIIQHPGGAPKRMSFFHNTVVQADARRVQYLTDTLHGSSGSPVFDRNWRVVAVHHSADSLPASATKTGRPFSWNEGTHIHAVLAGLE